MGEVINNHMPLEEYGVNNNNEYNKEYDDGSVPMDNNTRDVLKNSLRQILEQRKDDTENVMGDEYYEEVASTLSQMEREDEQLDNSNEIAGEN